MPTTMILEMDFVPKNCMDLDEYIMEALVPLKSHIDAFNDNTDKLIEFLKNKTALKIRRVVKGGTLGKGTSLKGKTNSEILLFLDDFRSFEDMKVKISGILEQIKRRLIEYKTSTALRNIKCTDFCVQLDMLVGDSWFPVQICPAHASSSEESHKKADNYELREYLNTTLTELHIQKIKFLPVKLKHLIRLVHHWNHHVAERHKNNAFTDYFVEVLVMWCWERAGVMDDVDTCRGMKTVMNELTKGNKINIDWKEIEKVNNVATKRKIHRNPELPFIQDPYNPEINLCEPFQPQCVSFWQRISQYASDTNKLGVLIDSEVW